MTIICSQALCAQPGTFWLPGEESRWCAKHRLPRMTDNEVFCAIPFCYLRRVNSKYCSTHTECGTDKCTNMAVEGHSHCGPHLAVELPPPCASAGCYNRAQFAVPPATAPTHCFRHQEPGSLDMLASETCADCNLKPKYAPLGKPAQWCELHRTVDAVDVYASWCLHPRCNRVPYFNFPCVDNTTSTLDPRWCVIHHKPGMVSEVLPENESCVVM